ncbi:Hsp20/alpha crystallin family protein [Candidatus Methylocalor cossyra]|uniref:Heat shock protein Hsp20 n=1 Tax=Candidatus Methylocalor cossyra TaxID=3108543 RepID=A0ABM9NGS3_9GAMM
MATEENKSTESGEKAVTQPARGQFLSPFDEFDQWFDELRRHWMQPFLFGRQWLEPISVFGGRIPRVDIIDRDDEICVRAELPGVDKDNLDVTLQENTLTIRATAQRDEKEEKGQYYRRELSRGEFQRTLRLPGPVEEDKVKAKFKDGILEVVIPKAPGAKRRSIQID